MSQTNLLMLDPPLWVGATAAYPYSPQLAQRYTVASRFGEVVKLWQGSQNGEIIKLPRAFCPPPTEETDRRSWGERKPITSVKVTPRDKEQADAIEDFVKLALAGESFGLEAPTGRGKTVITISALAQIGVPTLIVVPKEDLYDQWQAELIKFGTPKDLVGIVRQDKYAVVGRQVVVAMLHSLAIPGKYPTWFVKWPGLVVFDECHRLPTETFTEVCRMFSSRVRVGLSATHERSDGMEFVVRGHIGPIRIKLTQQMEVPKVLVYKTGWRVPMWNLRDQKTGERKLRQMPHSPGKVTHVIVEMCKNKERNLLLARPTVVALDKGRKVVFFSELLDHLARMEAIFCSLGVKPEDMGYYVGGLSKEERKLVSKKRLILATWGMMKEGTDIEDLDTAVLSTPRAAVTQPVGRIRRVYAGKKFTAVLDFRDDDSPVFRGYADKRLYWYYKIGAEVVNMN